MLQFQQHLFCMFFGTNDVMFHALWHHLLSLPCQFSISEDVGGWQPRTLRPKCERCTFFTSSSFDVSYVPPEPTNKSISEWHGGELDRWLRAAKCLWTTRSLSRAWSHSMTISPLALALFLFLSSPYDVI